jgi:DNA-binding transcriptional MerR regulator
VSAVSHLSIGEVLSLLQDEFPDITISKIRFLESQGLLEPERTPSGYRKFYPHDIERLRWILRQQRDHFLPLRVIKDKLEADAAAEAPPPRPADEPVEKEPAPRVTPDDVVDHGGPLDAAPTAVSLTLKELAAAAGLDVKVVIELQQYGLLSATTLGASDYYDGDALAAAKLAAGFRDYGVEARHLRMFRTAADREASVYEQMILPVVAQKNPAARRRAMDNLEALARLGEQMHRTQLRQALRQHRER